MEYKFKPMINQYEKEQYLEKNHTIIAKLLNRCFDVNFKNISDIGFLKKSDLFLCILDNQLVGIVSAGIDNNIYQAMSDDLSKSKIKTYDSQTYVYDSNQRIIFDPLTKKKIYITECSLGPVIQNFCKDPGYVKVGEFLLENIEKYYREKGFTKIYTVPESNKYKNQLLQAHYDYDPEDRDTVKNLNHILDKYRETQHKLINYYQNHGYVFEYKYYENEIMPYPQRSPGSLLFPFIMFYNVMVKIL